MAMYPLTVANTPRGEDLPEGGSAPSRSILGARPLL
jgi:hypothetical protein